MIRFLTAGESHGRCLVGILEGMPAGLAISEEEIAADLRRRQLGYGRGARMQIEQDRAQILSGVRYGLTIGSPIALMIENRDWPNWEHKMRVNAVPENEQEPALTRPRPGHADLAAAVKYGHSDIRNVIERSSARETAVRVALAAFCRKFFREFGVITASHVVRIGRVSARPLDDHVGPEDMNRLADANPVRCLDGEASGRMIAAIDEARERGDTLGGIFEVIVHGFPTGIGSHVHFDRRLDALLTQATMSIHAIKSAGIGAGEETASRPGSEVHDAIVPVDYGSGVGRATNRAGGIEGGISNGETIRIRAAMKPLSTLGQPLESVDMLTGEKVAALRERSDVCAVPAAAIVGEAMALLTLVNPFLEKFGGDSMKEIRAHIEATPEWPWG